MQLEKYVRSVLIRKIEERDNLIPSTDEHHINMAGNTNASRVIQGEHDRTSNIDMAPSTHHEFDTYSSRCNAFGVSSTQRNRKHRGIRRNKVKSIRRCANRNRRLAASISINDYNSLRIMVPSIASNTNASRVCFMVIIKNIKVFIPILFYFNVFDIFLTLIFRIPAQSCWRGCTIHKGVRRSTSE